MTAFRALHPQSDVDRLYLPRCDGGRGLQQVQQVMDEETWNLEEYVRKSEEPILQEVHNQQVFGRLEPRSEDYTRSIMSQRQEHWKGKALHGQYIKNIEGKINTELTWSWLKNGELKKETEGTILAAQEQALRTNAIKAKIDHTITDSKCRLCKEKEETVDHLISGCSKIAQTDYKQRHDKVATMLHWNLCKNRKLPAAEKWWQHKPEKIVQDGEKKILWDFRIQTDRHLEHNTPDIVVVDKKQVHIIDVAIPGDSRIDQKEIEKITKYKDLQIEIERLWKKKARVVPVVIGALGAIPKDLVRHLSTIGVDKITPHQLQKATLLGTAHILRKYM